MSKKNWLVGIVGGLIMAAAILYFNLADHILKIAGASEEVVQTTQLTATDTSDEAFTELINLMLNSHNRWRTLKGEATFTTYEPQGKASVASVTIQVEQFGRVRVETINQDTGRHFLRISGDAGIFDVDLTHLTYTPIPMSITMLEKDLERLPTTLSEVNANTFEGIPIVIAHPAADFLSSPLGSLIYPTGRAQRGGEYTSIGQGEILGRPTWVVNWQRRNNEGQLTLKEQYWVDMETGVILRSEQYYTGRNDEALSEVIEFTNIVFDESLDPALFTFTPAENMREVSVQEQYDLPPNFGKR